MKKKKSIILHRAESNKQIIIEKEEVGIRLLQHKKWHNL